MPSLVKPSDITIVIPTFGREAVLIRTVGYLLAQRDRASTIIVVDQSPNHEPETEKALSQWAASASICWIRLDQPSIPRAMNTGLAYSETPYVLYLDDDIVPVSTLVAAHATALSNHTTDTVWCIAGQVLQPGEKEISQEKWRRGWFPFNSNEPCLIRDVMAGNLCVNREKAFSVGGFDENFVGAAYRFESDFARRVIRAGGSIAFDPKASIRHLRAGSGGTRSYGSHLMTWRPQHAVGKYYYGFRGGFSEGLKTLIVQPLRAVRTRHHLRRPWWIPLSLAAELLGACWAVRLLLRGPRFAAVVQPKKLDVHSEFYDNGKLI